MATTYLWLTGHVRNVGDSTLRRPLATAVAEGGAMMVWAGDPRTGYAAGLQLPSGGMASSLPRWVLSFARSSITRRTNFVFNAGEFSVTKEYFFGLTALLPWILIAKARGGKVAWLGAGIFEDLGFFMLPFRALAWLSDDLRWRDSTSSEIMHRGGQMPDWAFGLPSVFKDGERDSITLSLRGDRPYPSSQWLTAVRDLAERLHKEIMVVVQVSDDHAMGERLATDLAASLIGWNQGNHFEQELLARRAYAASSLTISDRLHALIIAATEGSVPLGWVDRANGKIKRHFDWLGADWVWVDPAESIRTINGLGSDQFDVLAKATAELTEAARAGVSSAASALSTLLK